MDACADEFAHEALTAGSEGAERTHRDAGRLPAGYPTLANDRIGSKWASPDFPDTFYDLPVSCIQ